MSTAGGDGDDLPDPEIETIRNLVGDAWEQIERNGGALLRFDGLAVRDNGIELGVMTNVLRHFDQLARIIVAYKSGFEVKRRGRVTEVAGTRHLVAVPAVGGSFVMPLRLDPPEGEMFGTDHEELEEVVQLLDKSGDALSNDLRDMPERVGDEVVGLLEVGANRGVSVEVIALRDGKISARTTVTSDGARSRARQLTELKESEVGREVLRGTLFRIDTKRQRIAVDVSTDDDASAVVAEASFTLDLLEPLRNALRHQVEVTVDLVEQMRPYEHTARTRLLTVVSVEDAGPVLDDEDD